jgi:hypothetical protein
MITKEEALAILKDAHKKDVYYELAEYIEHIAKQAERWETVKLRVGGMYSGGWRPIFHIERIPVPVGVSIMKGSVAQHFEEAVDAVVEGSK